MRFLPVPVIPVTSTTWGHGGWCVKARAGSRRPSRCLDAQPLDTREPEVSACRVGPSPFFHRLPDA